MSRPKKIRKWIEEPIYTCFKPFWIPTRELKRIDLDVDEFQAMKYVDIENCSMLKWSELMWISSSTFHRLLDSGRKKVMKALSQGFAIRVYWVESDVNCWWDLD